MKQAQLQLGPTSSDELLAISLWRPWPSLFFLELVRRGRAPWGWKWLENRKRRPPSRLMGRDIALHAAQRYATDDAERLRGHGLDVPHDSECPTGIIGTIRIVGWVQVAAPGAVVDWVPTEGVAERSRRMPLAYGGITEAYAQTAAASPWCSGPFAWVVERPRLLAEAVPCPGQRLLGWVVPAGVVAEVRRQLGAE